MSKSQLIILVLCVALLTTLGALFLQPPAHAQTAYTQCGFLTIPNASNGAEQAGRPPANPIQVPRGWTPIAGGTYRDTLPGVIVCR